MAWKFNPFSGKLDYFEAGGVAIGDTVGSATAGSILFAGVSGVLAQDNANLFWDDTNNRLGIGIATPTEKIDVAGSIKINTNGTSLLISSYKGANSDGFNSFIGGGGQSSIGEVGATHKGSYNSAQGLNALFSNTAGYYNSAQGVQALYSNTTGSQNSAQGLNALYANTTGSSNSAQGSFSLFSNTTGYFNCAQGAFALYANTTGATNSAQGVQALYANTTGSQNSAQGAFALFSNTAGSYNSAQGLNALYSNTTGDFNSAQGAFSLSSNTTGSQNSAQGVYALLSNTTGNYNSAQGYFAGRSIVTGNSNTFVGYSAGYHASQLTSASNSMALGNGAYTTASNQVIIGNASVNVGLAQTIPTARLHLPAGTATANTAPLKFTSGVLNTTPEAGAVEFLTDAYYGTITTGATRKTFAFLEAPAFTTSITTPEVRVGANKVIGAQGAAVIDATDAASAITQLNDLLARCRAHGLIA